MKISRLGLAATLSTAAVVAVAAGVTAQDEIAPAPISISRGSSTGEPFDVSLANWDDETGQMTGLALSISVESTDPRLEGTLSMAATGAGERHGEGGVVIMRSTYRLANDTGAWIGQGWEVDARPGPVKPAVFREGTMVLEGEGAYEGLTAYVSIGYDGEVPHTEAVIVESTLPPAPDPIPLPAE